MTDAAGPIHPDTVAGAAAPRTALSAGEWHRLHPATPLLRGGVALIAVIGIIIANLRDHLIDFFVGIEEEGDPLSFLLEQGLLGLAILSVLGILLLGVLVFTLSWRMHTFRVSDEAVEVRSGVVFRTQRKARLDRIQGINIVRPFVARLFGVARLELTVAGQDANVRLDYLGSDAADLLRHDILSLASGMQRRAQGDSSAAPAGGALLQQRLDELLAPELPPDAAAALSVVRIPPGRLIGSTVLSGFTLVVAIVALVVIPLSVVNNNFYWVLGAAPALLGMASFSINRVTKSLRYSISASPDGIRIGYGLLSLSNETLPPGRIHAVSISQPLLWRPFGWWQIQVNRASSSSTKGAAGQANTTILPVGNDSDVLRVLQLALPEFESASAALLVQAGLVGRGTADDGFVGAPKRAVWLRPFSWRRTGFALFGNQLLFRKGSIWRALTVVPQARLQSSSLAQGPLSRRLDLAELQVQTVAGPVSGRMEVMDRATAIELFDIVRASVIESEAGDTSHRWGTSRLEPTAGALDGSE